jgi:hypothetical protein
MLAALTVAEAEAESDAEIEKRVLTDSRAVAVLYASTLPKFRR